MNQNIIVFGARRTGTSLLIEMLGKTKSNNLTIEKDKYNLSEKEFKTLQPFYNESIYHKGINDNNSINYYSLNNKIIKMFVGLFETDIKHFNTFRKILVTNRHWISQNRSNKNLMRINAKVLVIDKNFLDKKYNREEFIEDSIFDDGLEYGFFYSALVVDMCNRKYNDKIIIVDFEKLQEKSPELELELNKSNLSLKDGFDLINNKVTKYKTEYTREGLVEFKEGYFDYLDKLYECLTSRNISGEFVDESFKWFTLISNQLKKRAEFIYKKYNLVISKEIEQRILKGEITRDQN
jgi:hypothetical protein